MFHMMNEARVMVGTSGATLAMAGYQYRSAVWYHTPYQEAVVAAVKARLDDGSPSADAREDTAQAPAAPFYRAEEYHQNFILKQTGGVRMF